MEFLSQLWLPIVLSAVAVWFLSFLAWAVIGHHRNDYGGLPDEQAFVAALGTLGIPPGNYGFPHCPSRAGMKDPEFERRWKEGPTGLLTILGPMSMPRNMILSFLIYLIVGVFIAYLGWQALEPGAGFGRIFQITGAAGVLAYCFSFLPHGVWFGAYPRAMLLNVLDGVVYGLATGLVFALLWPAAA